MQTTPIIVEILIVGIQALIWIILLVLSVFGHTNFPPADYAIAPWSSVMAVAVLAIAYSLGVVFDRLIKLVFSYLVPTAVVRFFTRMALSANERREFDEAASASLDEQKRINEARVIIQLYHTDMMAVVEYIRSRVRIARATVFNTLLIMIAALLWLYNQPTEPKGYMVLSILIGGSAIMVLALMAYGVLDWKYKHRKWQVLEQRKAEGDKGRHR